MTQAGAPSGAATVTLVRGDREVRLGRVGGGARCDLGLVDRLLRLQLAARRLGWSVRLDDVRDDLRALLVLVGLADALALEPGRQAEGGEERGVEEVVDRRDPPA